MFREKRVIQNEIEEMEIELLKYSDIVTVLNNPIFQTKGSSYKMIAIIPILFVLLFTFGLGLKKLYYKAEILSKERE